MASLLSGDYSTDQIKSRYRRKVEIYLEGDDDLAIYKNYWFSDLTDKVNFIKAGDGVAKHPGCKGVIDNVRMKRAAGVAAFGMVDRDTINDPAVAFETNDATYVSLNFARNPHLYYTIRWELESYLLDMDALEQERVDAKFRGENKRSIDEVADELLAHCHILVAHAAVNVVLGDASRDQWHDHKGKPTTNRAEFEKTIFSSVMNNCTQQEREDYEVAVQKIEAFDLPGASTPERVYALCRRIHGKKLLNWFFKGYGIQDSVVFRLARKLQNRPPQELSNQLNMWLVNVTN